MYQNACAVTEMVTNFDLMSAVYRSGIAKKFKLNPSSFAVLIGLCNHYNNKKGVVFPSIEYLMEHLNLSKPTVIKAINDLIDKRLILKTKQGCHNVYAFTNVLFDTLHIEMGKTCQATAPKGKEFVPNRLNNFTSKGKETLPKQDNLNKINNNNKVISFYKNNNNYRQNEYFSNSKSIDSVKELLEEYKTIKKGSPLDMDKAEALQWLSELPVFLKESYFAIEVRKKWQQ